MSNNTSQTLIRGTMILTLATAISKILGFIYIVPFTALVGIQGNILFEYAYKPYVLLLSMATLGIPLAVSKFISKYNELGDYKTGYRLFKSGLALTMITGTLCFVALYLSAPHIAGYLISENDKTGNSLSDVTYVIRMVSFALIIVPPMAIVRGFFQGHQSMGPTAISQVVEQLVRILFILSAGFILINVFDKSVPYAVGFATFAAFIGAAAGSISLFIYWKKRRNYFQEQLSKSVSNTPVSLIDMYKELISYAIPFVIVGLSIPLYQSIDTFTINKAMMSIGAKQVEAETINSIVSLTQRVILIPVSLATAFSSTLVPAITKAYTGGDFDSLKQQIRKTFQIILFLTLPASFGLMILGKEAFGSLFGLDNITLGGELMMWSAPTAILFSLFIVTAAMLQGINKQKFAVISLLVGIAFKFSFTFYLVTKLEGIGSIISTNIGMTLSILLNLYVIRKGVSFSYRSLSKQFLLMMGFIIMMLLSVWGASSLYNHLIDPSIESEYLSIVIKLLAGSFVGGFVYIALSISFQLFFDIFGSRFSFLNKFRKKKTAD